MKSQNKNIDFLKYDTKKKSKNIRLLVIQNITANYKTTIIVLFHSDFMKMKFHIMDSINNIKLMNLYFEIIVF